MAKWKFYYAYKKYLVVSKARLVYNEGMHQMQNFEASVAIIY